MRPCTFLDFHPRDVETIPVYRPKSATHPTYNVTIDNKREDGIQCDASNLDNLRVYLDGLAHDGKVGAAAILYCGDQEPRILRYHLGVDSEHTVFKAEAVGELMALHLIEREHEVTTAIIGVDNTATL